MMSPMIYDAKDAADGSRGPATKGVQLWSQRTQQRGVAKQYPWITTTTTGEGDGE